MIFVTSGTQLPFDRFIQTIDEIAALFPAKEFLVQVIHDRHKIMSANVQKVDCLTPSEFGEMIAQAELVISHAGIGTIVSAAQAGKPLIVFPRFGKLKEHRNDHQVATCTAMQRSFPLNVATNTDELKVLMEKHFKGDLASLPAVDTYASGSLLNSIREFIVPETLVSFI
jgi:UDP-N-acetylglucosamine transferase subunit ALG13